MDFNIETEEFSKLFSTDNFQEGVSAFIEKRKPDFNKDVSLIGY